MSAVLNGTVNPNGLAATGWFEYGTSAGLSGYSTTTVQSVGSGTGTVPLNATLSGLADSTKYYFRMVGSGLGGTHRGTILNFTTVAKPEIEIETISDPRPGTPVVFTGRLTVRGQAYIPPSGFFGVEDAISQMSRTIAVAGNGTFSYSTNPTGYANMCYMIRFVLNASSGVVEKTVNIPVTFSPGTAAFRSDLKVQVGVLPATTNSATDASMRRLPGGSTAPLSSHLWKTTKAFGAELGGQLSTSLVRWWSSPTNRMVFVTAVGACGVTVMTGGAAAPACAWAIGAVAESFVTTASVNAAHKVVDELVRSGRLSAVDAATWHNLVIPTGEQVAGALTLGAYGNVADYLTEAGGLGEWAFENPEIVRQYYRNGVLAGFTIVGRSLTGSTFSFSTMPKEVRALRIAGHSPIDLVVVDPLGRWVKKDSSQVPDASYDEFDVGEGQLVDEVLILDPIEGEYHVHAVSDSNANPTDTYSISMDYTYADTAIVLAEDVPINSTPSEPYSFTLGGPVTVIRPVNAGWNLVSIPVGVLDHSKDQLFPSAISSAFFYEGGYISKSILDGGNGFWLKFSSDDSILFTGGRWRAMEIDVRKGWNIIGSVTEPMAINEILSIPPGLITSAFWGYAAGYAMTDSIYPGKGYWVKASQAGILILSANAAASNPAARIKIQPTSDLPPPPPDGDISHPTSNIPESFGLEQNYPNPFNPVTVFRFQIPVSSRATLKVYDVLGREVAVLVDEAQEPGYKSVEWDASGVASGIYFYRMYALDVEDASKSFTQVRKLVLLR